MNKVWQCGPSQKATVIQTDVGFESAFAHKDNRGNWEEFSVEPGFPKATRAEAEAAMEKDLALCRQIDGASYMYNAQYSAACGY